MVLIPAACASRGAPKATGSPRYRTTPPSGRCTPVMILIRVDLPAPFSPTNAWTWPACRARSTRSSARVPANRLETSTTSTVGERGSGAATSVGVAELCGSVDSGVLLVGDDRLRRHALAAV